MAQSLGDGHDGVGVGFGQEDGELVAAVAAEDVGASQLGGDHGRQVAEHFVGRVVAERVVDGLEAVYVEEDDAQIPVRDAGLGEEVIELLAEGAHVVEAGQTVAVCELLEPLGTLFQLGPFPLQLSELYLIDLGLSAAGLVGGHQQLGHFGVGDLEDLVVAARVFDGHVEQIGGGFDVALDVVEQQVELLAVDAPCLLGEPRGLLQGHGLVGLHEAAADQACPADDIHQLDGAGIAA